MGTKLYKVLVDGKSCHGGNHTWDLPKGKKPGKWQTLGGAALALCHVGFHLTDGEGLASWWKQGATAYEVEVEGEAPKCSGIGDDRKVVVGKVRLLRVVDEKTLNEHRVFTTGTHEIHNGISAASGSATVSAYGSATVRAYGSATVRAYGSATVRASDSATVRASGSATVSAYDSATVSASGSATVSAYGSATVSASGSATVSAFDSATVRASGSATVSAYDSATVRASGSATVSAYDSATVRASGSATVRAYGSATVRAYGSVVVTSQAHWLGWVNDAKVTLADRAVWIDQRGTEPSVKSAVSVHLDAAAQ